MKIVNLEVEILITPEESNIMLHKIERMGRICYQSQERISEDLKTSKSSINYKKENIKCLHLKK